MEKLALIYLPGINAKFYPQDAMEITARVKAALELSVSNSPNGSGPPSLHAQKLETIEFDGSRGASVATLRRVEDGGVRSQLDVYSLMDMHAAIDTHSELSAWARVKRGARLLLSNALRLRRFFTYQNVSDRHGAVIIYSALTILGLSLYLFSLLVSVILIVSTATIEFFDASSMVLPSTIESQYEQYKLKVLAGLPIVYGFLAIVKRMVPQGRRKIFNQLAAANFKVLEYFGGESPREEFTRSPLALIKHLERDGSAYDKVFLVGYSFGAIVLLDTVMPMACRPVQHPLHRISKVATIGLPYDAFQVFWPRHYTARIDAIDLGSIWINVSIPDDTLSTLFEPDPSKYIPIRKGGKCSPIIELTPPDWNEVAKASSFVRFFGLGFHSFHSRYWDSRRNHAGCWNALAPKLLADTIMLSGLKSASGHGDSADTFLREKS